MKTITISDEIYEKLIQIKGNRSFSQLIDELIIKDVEKRIDLLIEAAEKTGYEKELEEISKKIRTGF
ncbi:MAG: antitoxin VapB family protein, partial [Candidatus Heimdallarchaeaceae archaeon]